MAHDLFIFLHIPRTGGTTLNSIFFNNFKEEEIVSIYERGDFDKAAQEIATRLDSLRLIQGHFMDDGIISELLRARRARAICFIRHPVERLVSEYLFLKNWPHSHMYELIRQGNVSFADYIALDDRKFRFKGKNFMTRVFSRLSFSNEPSAEVEEIALAQAREYAFMGFTEFFDASLLLLGDLMGFAETYYERRNMVAPTLKEHISPEDRELAAQYNAADIRLYETLRKDFTTMLDALPDDFNQRVARFKLINNKFNKVSALLNQRHGMDKAEIINPKRLWEC